MKKLICVLMSMLLLAGVSTGCASQSTTSEADTASAAQTTTAETTETAEDADAAEAVASSEEVIAPVGDPITLKLSSDHTEDYVTSKAVDYFAQRANELSGGTITVDCYYNAVLGAEKEAVEQCQYGGIDIVRVSVSPLSEFCPSFQALSFPFIYEDVDHYWRVLDSDIGISMLHSDEMEAAGLYGLCYFDGGSRSFFFADTEVHTPADMKDLDIRTQESSLMIGMVKAIGANPVAMTGSEQYSALQTGVIDGAENNLPYYLSQSFNEVAPYITLDEHTRIPDSLVLSTATRDKMSAEQLAVLEQAAAEASQMQRELWAESEAESKQTCIDLGCTVIDLTADEKQQFMDAVKDFNTTEGATYIDILNAIAGLQ